MRENAVSAPTGPRCRPTCGPIFHMLVHRWTELAEIVERNPDLLTSRVDPESNSLLR
jgi:hypothetical protein